MIDEIDFKELPRSNRKKGFAAHEGKNYDLIFAGRLIKEKNAGVRIKTVFLLKKASSE